MVSARVGAGALELRLDWIDLREIVDRVVSAARRRGALKRSRSNCRSPARLAYAEADAGGGDGGR
jgi:two-component system sensor histidine kinase KdpD